MYYEYKSNLYLESKFNKKCELRKLVEFIIEGGIMAYNENCEVLHSVSYQFNRGDGTNNLNTICADILCDYASGVFDFQILATKLYDEMKRVI